jgi:hypothetical protein
VQDAIDRSGAECSCDPRKPTLSTKCGISGQCSCIGLASVTPYIWVVLKAPTGNVEDGKYNKVVTSSSGNKSPSGHFTGSCTTSAPTNVSQTGERVVEGRWHPGDAKYTWGAVAYGVLNELVLDSAFF